ncbi:MAG: PadR family transcriptional regulator [Candidatus Omnitrophica bacterium]|nr:PadR family transcriptional regulator [Candidatus Omnitrophota bacterium]
MIEQEITLLGLLKESPKHGYEIKKKIKSLLSLFGGAEIKSIYYPLTILEKRGLVVKRVNKQGKRPARFVYELTPKGHARFEELLNESFLNFKRPQFSLDLSLYFLHYIKPEIAGKRLKVRMRVLEKLSIDLIRTINLLKRKKQFSSANILEHNLQMVDSEIKFLSNLIATL